MAYSRRQIRAGASGFILMAPLQNFLTACSGTQAGAVTKDIVVSFSDLSQPFFAAMRRDLEDEARKLGVKIQVLDGQNNASKQVSNLKAAVIHGVGALIIAPFDSRALT